jgi:hypothetical protein
MGEVDRARDSRWRGDGRELLYLSAGQLMAVDVKTADATFDAGEPKPLFDLPGPIHRTVAL